MHDLKRIYFFKFHQLFLKFELRQLSLVLLFFIDETFYIYISEISTKFSIPSTKQSNNKQHQNTTTNNNINLNNNNNYKKHIGIPHNIKML